MAGKLDKTPPLLRAFALLERIARADGPVSLRDVAQESGLPKPTVYRMLAMLESASLVVRESEGRRLAPGPRLTRIGLDALLNASARAPRHAILKTLAQSV